MNTTTQATVSSHSSESTHKTTQTSGACCDSAEILQALQPVTSHSPESSHSSVTTTTSSESSATPEKAAKAKRKARVEELTKRLQSSSIDTPEDGVIRAIRLGNDIPLSPDVRVLTDLWSVPPSPDEIAWIRACDHKARTCTWQSFSIMAIRNHEFLKREDFSYEMVGQLFPNIMNDDGTTQKLGSANFFRKVMQATKSIEAALEHNIFSEVFLDWLDSDPFVASALLMKDTQLFTRAVPIGHTYYVINRPGWYNQLTRVRMALGAGGRNYGYGMTMNGESGEEAQGFFSAIKKGANWTLEKLNDLWSGMLTMVKDMASTVAAYARDLVSWLDKNIMVRITNMVKGLSADVLSNALKFLAGVLAACVLSLLGIVTWRKAKAFLWTASEADEDDSLTAESEEAVVDGTALGEDGEEVTEETVGFLSEWMARIFDLSDRAIEKIATRAKSLASLAVLAKIGVSAAASCLFYACYMWSDGVQILTGEVDADERDWVERAAMVTTLSKNQGVIFSDAYGECVMSLLYEGKNLSMSNVKPENKLLIAKYFAEIVNLAKNIEQLRQKGAERVTPYCVAIYGPAGTGKSMMVDEISKALVPGSPIYYRPIDEYWNGFAGEKVICYDEFQAHPEANHDKEFLNLVAPSIFQPCMASTDNFVVGQKGATAAPKLVITTSNRQFPESKVEYTALQRRRNVNLEVTLTREARELWCDEENFLDMSKVPEDVARNKGYLQIRFCKRVYVAGETNPSFVYSFQAAMRLIKEGFRRQQETGERILAAKGLTTSSQPAQEIMDEVLAKIRSGVSGRKPTLMDYIPWRAQVNPQTRRRRRRQAQQAGQNAPDLDAHNTLGPLSDEGEDDETLDRDFERSQFDPTRPPPTPESESNSDSTRKPPLPESECPVMLNGVALPRLEPKVDISSSEDRLYDSDAFEHEKESDRTSDTQLSDSYFVDARDRSPDYQGPYFQKNRIAMRATMAAWKAHQRKSDGRWIVEKSPGFDSERVYPEGENTGLSHPCDIDDECNTYNNTGEPTLDEIESIGLNATREPKSTGFLDRLSGGWKSWTLAALVPMLCWGVWSLAKWVLGKSTHPEGEVLELEAQAGTYKKPYRNRNKRKYNLRWKGGVGEARLVGSNVGKLTMNGASVNATFLQGRTFVAPAHFFRRGDDVVPNGTVFHVLTENNSLEIPFESTCARWTFDNDLLFYRVSAANWKPMKDISSRLIKDSEYESFDSCAGSFNSGPSPKYIKILRSKTGNYSFGGAQYDIQNGLVYGLNTQPGDCGSFVMATDGPSQGKIVGLHVAGSTSKGSKPNGFAVPLTAEIFAEAFHENEVPQDFIGDGEAHTEAEVAEHFKQVASHKKAVLLLGMQVPKQPVPWGVLRRHDDSKLTHAEVTGYVDRWVKMEKTDAWEKAQAHHFTNNPHHPEWWGEDDMDELHLIESVIDGLACAWERDYGMKKIKLSELAKNVNPKTGEFKEWVLKKYTASDKVRVTNYLQELRMTDIVVDPEFDVCEWDPNFRKDIDAFMKIVDGPNVSKVEAASYNNVAPGVTKLRPTIFHGKMGHGDKVLPVLSQKDYRARGYDPLVTGARLASKNVQVKIDKVKLRKAKELSLKRFKETIPKKFNRQMTFEEAIQGIPGLIKGIDTKTSPGYPLVRERAELGKKDFIKTGADGTLTGTEYLRERVEGFLERLEAGEDIESIFLAHLKDERVSQSKVDDLRTRVVYCGDLIANVAFRMKFGAGLINFNNSGAGTPSVIGINPMSHDVDRMKEYLDEVGDGEYLAGDYKSFDVRYQEPIRDAAYEILGELLEYWIPDFDKQSWEAHVKHQTTNAKVQYGRWLVSLIAIHLSGLFWTTIINIIVNDLYSRMAFVECCPKLDFDKHVRAQYHGDDNRMKFSKTAVNAGLTPIRWAQAMVTVGQEYTSDVKGEALTTKFKSWEKCSFLGAFPRMVGDKWSGALRLESLYGAPQWKRAGESEAETVDAMLDLGSQWDVDTYTKFYVTLCKINDSQPEQARIEIKNLSYGDRAVRQAQRTGPEEGWVAQARVDPGPLTAESPPVMTRGGPEEKPIIAIESSTAPVMVPAAEVNAELAARSIHAGPMGIEAALSQKVFRKAITWSGAGLSEDVSISAPYEVLSLGEQSSMQNLAFQMYIWWKGNVVFDIQLNAQVFCQGTLVAYWRPLTPNGMGNIGGPGDAGKALTCHHVKIQPGTTSYQLVVPYIHPRSVLNNFAQSEGDGSLGSFHLEVMNPLRTAAASTTPPKATVSIFSSFQVSQFTLPKPLGALPERKIKAKWLAPPSTLNFRGEGQGGGHSTTNNNVWVTAGGDVPVEIDNSGQTSSGPDVSADVSLPIPMDMTPVVGGGIPVFNQYSGMAKSNGLRPTVGMSLHPKVMARTMKDLWPLGSPILRDLMMREDRARVLNWSVNDNIGDKLDEWQVTMGGPPPGTALTDRMTIHQHIASLFQFFRGDYRMNLLVAKTPFHTGKLRVVVGYGVPAGITFAQSSNYEAFILDFDSMSNSRIVDVPYNAETPWLNTYSGPYVTDPVQDFVLATIAVFVQNELVAPESVADTVEVNVIEQYPNMDFAVPRPFSFGSTGPGELWSIPGVPVPTNMDAGIPPAPRARSRASPQGESEKKKGFLSKVTSPGHKRRNAALDPSKLIEPGPLSAESFPGEDKAVPGSSGDPAVMVSGETSVAMPDAPKEVTETQAPLKVNAPCKVIPGEHFEYIPRSVPELGRRMCKMTQGRDWIKTSVVQNPTGSTPVWPGTPVNMELITIQVRPVHPFVGYFCGWRGSIHIRIFNSGINLTAGTTSRACFIPLKENSQISTTQFKPMDVAPYLIDGTLEQNYALTPSTSADVRSTKTTTESAYPAVEALYPVSLGHGFIDLLCPFQSIFNFLPVQELLDTTWEGIVSIPVSVGQVQVLVPTGSETTVYSSFGDDLMMGGFKGMVVKRQQYLALTTGDVYPFGMNV